MLSLYLVFQVFYFGPERKPYFINDEFVEEEFPHFSGFEFATELVSVSVDALANLRMHGLGEIQSVFTVENVGDASLS